MKILSKIGGNWDESDKQGGSKYSWYLGTMPLNIPLEILEDQCNAVKIEDNTHPNNTAVQYCETSSIAIL